MAPMPRSYAHRTVNPDNGDGVGETAGAAAAAASNQASEARGAEESEDRLGAYRGGGGSNGDSSSGDDLDDDDDDSDDDEVEDGDDATMTDAAAVPGAASTETAGDTGTARDDGSSTAMAIKAVPNLDSLFGLREMGREALCWQLSSAKPGNGVEQIRDGSVDTYWQSDGNSQPHWIQVSFGRRVAISHVCLYLDHKNDESYTPRRLQVQVGMTDQDLISAMHPPMTQVEFHDPVGWCIIPLSAPPDPLDDYCPTAGKGGAGQRGIVRAHLVRISVLSMHQNGRDTHVRQVQLYGPRLAGSNDHNRNVGASSSSSPNPSESDPYTILSRRNIRQPVPFRSEADSHFYTMR
jgi:anaphase-promoting complex subunit 10